MSNPNALSIGTETEPRPSRRPGKIVRTCGALSLAAALTACDASVDNQNQAPHTIVITEPHFGASQDIAKGYTGSEIPEMEQQQSAKFFTDYHNGKGVRGELQQDESVAVDCIEYDPHTSITSTAGLWYRLPPESDGTIKYIAANTFWNQDPPEPPDQNNQYDPQVHLCADSPGKVLPPPQGTHGG